MSDGLVLCHFVTDNLVLYSFTCGFFQTWLVVHFFAHFLLLLLLFQAWPQDALELVAHKFLDDVEMSQAVREETVAMCQHFHESVRQLSERLEPEKNSMLWAVKSLAVINSEIFFLLGIVNDILKVILKLQ